jgi:hypothetical protein
VHHEVIQLLEEQDDVDDLRDNQADLERQLEPARGEDQARQRAQISVTGSVIGAHRSVISPEIHALPISAAPGTDQ